MTEIRIPASVADVVAVYEALSEYGKTKEAKAAARYLERVLSNMAASYAPISFAPNREGKP